MYWFSLHGESVVMSDQRVEPSVALKHILRTSFDRVIKTYANIVEKAIDQEGSLSLEEREALLNNV